MAATKKNRKKKSKSTALIVCQDGKQFWTTQKQFWQWARDGVLVKVGDNPLTGSLKREHEETVVVLSNTLLNLAHPNHLRETLDAKRRRLPQK